jgi:CubicO group peptidase (beta-lactamase class C family)
MTGNHVTADMVEGSFLGDPLSIGFGLGFYVIIDAARRESISSDGEYGWGGYFGTSFFIAPGEDNLIAIMMSQRVPGPNDPLRQERDEFKSLVYEALTD